MASNNNIISSSSSNSINIANCPSCSATINIPPFSMSNIDEPQIRDVFCKNEACKKPNIFACLECCAYLRACHFSTRKHPGIFKQWSYRTTHLNSKAHKKAEALKMESRESPDSDEEESMNVDSRSNNVYDEEEGVACGEDSSPVMTNNPSTLYPVGSPVKRKEDFCNLGFAKGSKSPDFFWFEHENPGQGVKLLTAKAFSVPVEKVTEEEAKFSLKLSRLLVQLTEKQRKLLADCLLAAVNSGNKDLSIFQATRVPVSEKDFHDIYMSKQTSILRNLPQPVPQTTNDKTHAYVSLMDVLANELAKATPFDNFDCDEPNEDDYPTLSTTPAARKLLTELKEDEQGGGVVLYLWLKEWRDDFDPNNTKSSRNQVWMLTNTIAPPPKDDKGNNTYFMALSGKGEDHSEVEMIHAEELKILSTEGRMFYHGGMKRIIKVKVGKLSTCVDRPERTTIFQVGDHNGSFSPFWGHACNVDGGMVDNCLPSCMSCRRSLLQQQLVGAPPSLVPRCPTSSCSRWDVFDPCFSSASPKDYPTKSDERTDAPPAPKGREVTPPAEVGPATDDVSTQQQPLEKRPRLEGSVLPMTIDKSNYRLPTVMLSAGWLKHAVKYAHHNAKTRPPNEHRNKRYWNKGVTQAYLRSCGLTNKLITSVCDAAKNDLPLQQLQLPSAWDDPHCLERNHYAAMHMIFLGNVSSGIDMNLQWLGSFDIKGTFGKQANKYLRAIQALRIHKYFPAMPLSPSSWGTGVYVSENYLFWARIAKFFFTLPALHQPRLSQKPNYTEELRMIKRFAMAKQCCVSRLMCMKRSVPDLDRMIHIYLDSMVEVDFCILDKSDSGSGNTAQDAPTGEPPAPTAGVPTTPTTAPAAKTKKRKKNPNFVKANSLGLLSAARAHNEQGPAPLHWEGGYAGERKIQPVKPLLSIKRSNADWVTITLRNLHANEAIGGLLSSCGEQEANNREMEGALRIYKNRAAALESILECQPLSAVLSKKEGNSLWVPYRPVGRPNCDSRSSVELVRLKMDDSEGTTAGDLCWVCPVSATTDDDIQFFETVHQLNNHFAEEFVLLLPQLSPDGGQFVNLYYCVGHHWTERVSSGAFVSPDLSPTVFEDWTTEQNEFDR